MARIRNGRAAEARRKGRPALGSRTKASGVSPAKYSLKLYVAGTSRRSAAAIRTITEICEQYLKGRYDLRIIDIYQKPTLARGEQIVAAPTLIKKLPIPLRRLIGDLADVEKVLVGLDLRPRP